MSVKDVPNYFVQDPKLGQVGVFSTFIAWWGPGGEATFAPLPAVAPPAVPTGDPSNVTWSSVRGLPMPIGRGKRRINGRPVWHSKTAGSDTATVAYSIGARLRPSVAPIVVGVLAGAVTVYSTASGWHGGASGTFYDGDNAQAAIPEMVAQEGAAHTPAYRGQGIFLLTLDLSLWGGRLPPVTFFLEDAGGGPTIPLAEVLVDLLVLAKLQASDVVIENVADTIPGISIAADVSPISLLQNLNGVFGFDYFERAAKVVCRKVPLDPVVPDWPNIPPNDWLTLGGASDAISSTTILQAERQAQKEVNLSYIDTAIQFQQSMARARSEATLSEQVAKYETPIIMDASQALTQASLALLQAEADGYRHAHLYGPRYLAGEPSDVATWSLNGRDYTTKITSITLQTDLSVAVEYRNLMLTRNLTWEAQTEPTQIFTFPAIVMSTTGTIVFTGHPPVVSHGHPSAQTLALGARLGASAAATLISGSGPQVYNQTLAIGSRLSASVLATLVPAGPQTYNQTVTLGAKPGAAAASSSGAPYSQSVTLGARAGAAAAAQAPGAAAYDQTLTLGARAGAAGTAQAQEAAALTLGAQASAATAAQATQAAALALGEALAATPSAAQARQAALALGARADVGAAAAQTQGAPGAPLDGISGLTGAWSLSRDMLSAWGGATRYDTATGVSSVKDQTGNGRHFANATGSQQPALATAGPNARACADFDGNDDKLASAVVSTFLTAGAGYMVVSVMFDAITRGNPTRYVNHAILADDAGYVGLLAGALAPNAVTAYNWDGNSDVVDSPAAIATATAYVIEWKHEAGNVYCRVDGGTWASVASGSTSSLSGTFQIGAGYSGAILDGKVFEAATFGTVPSSADQDAIVANMKSYVSSHTPATYEQALALAARSGLAPAAVVAGGAAVALGVSGGLSTSGAIAASPQTAWNPADKAAEITLSNGNRKATTATQAHRAIRSVASVTATGSYYAEWLIEQRNGASVAQMVGIALSSASLSNYLGSSGDSASVGFAHDGTIFFFGIALVHTGVSFGPGDVIGMRFIKTADSSGTVAFYKNNALAGTLSGFSGGGSWYLAASVYGDDVAVTLPASLTYSVPGGFTVGWPVGPTYNQALTLGARADVAATAAQARQAALALGAALAVTQSGVSTPAGGTPITVADLVNYGFTTRYKFKDTSTLTLVSADHVSGVTDQFGTNHLTQATDANRPQSLGTSGVRFNNVTDTLGYPVSSLTTSRQFTVVASAAALSGNGNYIWNSTPTAGGVKILYINGPDGKVGLLQYSGPSLFSSTAMTRNGTQRTLVCDVNIAAGGGAGTMNTRFDGAGDILTFTSFNPNESGISHAMGGAEVFTWKDMVASDRQMPWSELPFFEAVMAWENGTQANLPVGHPYAAAAPVLPAVASTGVTRVKTGYGLWSGPAGLAGTEFYLGKHYIGAPGTNRVVLVAVTTRRAVLFEMPGSSSYPKINGVSCDAASYISVGNSNADGSTVSVVVEMFWQPVPTGSYAEIIMQQPATNGCDYQFTVYVLNGLASTTPFHTASTATADGSVALNIPANGVAIAADVSKGGTTWTGLTEDQDVSYTGYHGTHTLTSASGTGMSAQTGRTISVSSAGTYDAFGAVSFAGTAVPAVYDHALALGAALTAAPSGALTATSRVTQAYAEVLTADLQARVTQAYAEVLTADLRARVTQAYAEVLTG